MSGSSVSHPSYSTRWRRAVFVNLPKSTSKSSWLTVPAEQWVKVSTWTQARSVRVGKGQEVRDLEAVKCLRVSRFERQIQKDSDAALTLVNEGLHVYPKAAKLWMMKGQTYEARNALPQAREAYNTGTRACPQSVPLWLLASRLEERMGVLVKARSILDRARLAVPKNPELWTESVRLEYRAKNMPAAQQKMAQALQECPTSGLVWSERIWHLEARTQRKPRILEAIQKADNDPILFVTAARIFWGERKLDKAASWFQKAAILDPDYGDTWSWWYTFLVQHGTEEKRAEVMASCVANEPKHGEYWARTRKAPENAGLGVEEVLRLVAKELV
ncbi:U4/U6 x U5 tri-snRNP complex subunit Prp1 [Friedmanniomyces endolithicus]|nr:U4/U6 x U5 tri-snRNP complex subunit Prp1 [Friedmanniomyces endolithicus]